MIDIKIIREKKDLVKKALKSKKVNLDFDKFIALDEKRQKFMLEVEALRTERNKIARLGKDGVEEGKRIKEDLKKIEPAFEQLNKEYTEMLYQFPNIPSSDVEEGASDKENKVIKQVKGRKLEVDKIKDHSALGEDLDIIDTKQAGIVAGSRFAYLKNQAVILEFALVQYILDMLMKEKFIPMLPPVIEKFEVARGTGYFETLSDDAYHLKDEDAILVGTSEQSLVPYRMNYVFQEKQLPERYVGFSTCFRREAGSYGKDVTGIFRVHQFDKLEMVTFVRPEDSDKEHKYLLSLEEKIVAGLEIPYQVIKMCTGDLGLPAARKYDIESWIPSQDKYRETHSVSTCTDFQARRLNIKYRTKDGKTEFVHTLNGTAIAMGRMIIAIMENYQQKDGSILVPKVLQKYTGFEKISK